MRAASGSRKLISIEGGLLTLSHDPCAAIPYAWRDRAGSPVALFGTEHEALSAAEDIAATWRRARSRAAAAAQLPLFAAPPRPQRGWPRHD